MKDECDLQSMQNRAWTAWYYLYYFLELEWERFTPFFNPIFVASIVHHAITTLEVYETCIMHP